MNTIQFGCVLFGLPIISVSSGWQSLAAVSECVKPVNNLGAIGCTDDTDPKHLINCDCLSELKQRSSMAAETELKRAFKSAPLDTRPGVYWYFMDGNQDSDEMVADLEAMAEAGIGSVLFLEVNIGVPIGPVPFMSERWQENIILAIKTTERLGMEFILGTGPGWAGSGGSWVPAEDSMQHLVGNSIEVEGPALFEKALPVPAPHDANPYSGMNDIQLKARQQWYQDVAVLAFPSPEGPLASFSDFNTKVLKDIRPYSVRKNSPTTVVMPADYPEVDGAVLNSDGMIGLTHLMQADGTLRWEVPEGNWMIMRFVSRSTGQTTRPAPRAGHGFENDKFNADSYRRHWDNFQGRILERLGPRTPGKGLTTIHLDSWEMSSQNWTADFREEFTQRRGYDPQPYFPAYMGKVVDSLEVTERFLWDMRKTAQELVLEEYAGVIKEIAHEHGLVYSNEPYDMNPAGNLDLGSVADIPQCEFWNAEAGPDTQYSCIEAVSIAHTMGKSVVKAEAFTTGKKTYQHYPASMKNQTDWAFAIGINGLVFHTYQHQPLGDDAKPGMTMGPYGINWHRHHTMWHLFSGYHEYISRCQTLLRQGEAVADILYLTPESAPHVFKAPNDALSGTARLLDKKGHNFDAVTPRILKMRAEVVNGEIVFPGGTSYRLLVLPDVETMTLDSLIKIYELVDAGATVIGNPPKKSPSLVGYPDVDLAVQKMAKKLWGEDPQPERQVGKGRILLSPGPLPPAFEPWTLRDAANWIWYNKGEPERKADLGEVYFRAIFDITDVEKLTAALVQATADNRFTLKINDHQVLSGDDFSRIESADVLPQLHSGKNVLVAVASNLGGAPNPAGFIASVHLSEKSGGTEIIRSGAGWQASLDGENWSAAKTLGSGGMAPWILGGLVEDDKLYPHYSFLEETLAAMGVPQDFYSDGPIRYGHRRTEREEIYFVANRSDQMVQVDCSFRVTDRAAELWDPLTGNTRPLAESSQTDGVTSIPMVFQPHQSFFVIFGAVNSSQVGSVKTANFLELEPVQDLIGPWKVSFDPAWGGPGEVVFDKLSDWTENSERGIQYYSGSATYLKSFDFAQNQEDGKRIVLDLGTVHNICRVRLNGEDLGIVWTAPWQIDITYTVSPRDNQLEIEVVNLWPNRLIGDQQAPDKDARTLQWDSGLLGKKAFKTGRYTFTTGKISSDLLPSGLIGPVTIRSSAVN